MPRSNASFLGQLLGTSQKITASALDDSVSASLGGGGSVTTYATAAALPLSGNTAGDQAFVSETGRLYIFTGAGWYNIALINTNPNISSGANASYSLNIDGTPTVITLVANDPEGIPITWSYAVTSGSLTNGGGTSATVTQVDNEFTITPSTNQAYEGVFDITFTASDGVNLATSASTFRLAWIVSTVDYLVVAGGGGGGSVRGGGGGAGGFLTGTGFAVTDGVPIAITVGAGGAGGIPSSKNGKRGSNSVFSTITATGGGGGVGEDQAAGTNGTGGSGGGAAGSAVLIGFAGNTPSVSPSQGNNGGNATYSAPNYGSGGGGGASSVGTNGTSTVAGNGGNGTANSYSGSSVIYAGGGGGGTYQGGTAGTGGSGGGGNAGLAGGSNVGTAGTANTGGGGGGSSFNGVNVNGGDGGSGIVILRYPDSFTAATSTTGSPTITVAGGYRIYKFTQSGSITF